MARWEFVFIQRRGVPESMQNVTVADGRLRMSLVAAKLGLSMVKVELKIHGKRRLVMSLDQEWSLEAMRIELGQAGSHADPFCFSEGKAASGARTPLLI